jgi:hypothetical protein
MQAGWQVSFEVENRPDRTILYRCLECKTVVTEPPEW